MNNVNRTIIVTEANASLARALAAQLSAGGVGMFEAARYTNGALTHYVSSGQIDAAFDSLLPLEGSSQATKEAARDALFAAAGGLATLAQCQVLVDTTIVVDCDAEPAEATFLRLGLSIQP